MRAQLLALPVVVAGAFLVASLTWTALGASSLQTIDVIPGDNDRRGAVNAATNVFIGQVVDEQLICLPTSGGSEHLMTSDHFFVKIERNLKGRVEGTVEVRQDTDDTGQYGSDGRLQSGKKYLFITRYLQQVEYFSLVDYNLGYVLIDDPEERAALNAEVQSYLDAPYSPTPTIERDPDTLATWDAAATERATMSANAPTPFPCESWVAATATAAAPSLNRDNRALGPIFSPDWEWPTVPANPEP